MGDFETMKHGLSLILVLLIGCSSLTPERINTLAAIAGAAAQIGAAIWLEQHPDQAPAFESVLQNITMEMRRGDTNKAVQLLRSLPVSTLRSYEGELYMTGDHRGVADEKTFLVVYDSKTGKPTRISKAQEPVVMEEVRRGLKRAVVQKPPALPQVRHRRHKEEGITPEGAPPVPGSDAALDAEFEAVKARLKTR